MSAQPTSQPSSRPTINPSSKPSYVPSKIPSSNPTSTPSLHSSQFPTKSPSLFPSYVPSTPLSLSEFPSGDLNTTQDANHATTTYSDQPWRKEKKQRSFWVPLLCAVGAMVAACTAWSYLSHKFECVYEEEEEDRDGSFYDTHDNNNNTNNSRSTKKESEGFALEDFDIGRVDQFIIDLSKKYNKNERCYVSDHSDLTQSDIHDQHSHKNDSFRSKQRQQREETSSSRYAFRPKEFVNDTHNVDEERAQKYESYSQRNYDQRSYNDKSLGSKRRNETPSLRSEFRPKKFAFDARNNFDEQRAQMHGPYSHNSF